MATTTTEIPSSMSLLAELTGPELTYTHTLVQQLSSVYYQLIQDTDEGLYLAQWLSSEIKLRVEAAWGETIYPIKCSQMLGTVEHHRRDPKPKYNSGCNPHVLDLRIRKMMSSPCRDWRLGSISHMISDSVCKGGGWIGGCGHLENLLGVPGQSWVVLWICTDASTTGLDQKEVNPINLRLWDRMAI